MKDRKIDLDFFLEIQTLFDFVLGKHMKGMSDPINVSAEQYIDDMSYIESCLSDLMVNYFATQDKEDGFKKDQTNQ